MPHELRWDPPLRPERAAVVEFYGGGGVLFMFYVYTSLTYVILVLVVGMVLRKVVIKITMSILATSIAKRPMDHMLVYCGLTQASLFLNPWVVSLTDRCIFEGFGIIMCVFFCSGF